MKFNIKYILKISGILAVLIFIIERLVFGGGFDLSINEFAKVLGIHFMYATVLTALNAYFFYSLEVKYSWKENSKNRLVFGALGSIILTMIGLTILRFVTLVVILGHPLDRFLNDPSATWYYTFGLVITLIVSLVFHVVFFYKALSEKKVTEQQIVAKTETGATLNTVMSNSFGFGGTNAALIFEKI